MLYSVHENQQIIVTGSSPEPLIAEASVQNHAPHPREQVTIHGFMESVGEICQSKALSES